MPITPDELLARLATLGISVVTYDHPPVFTVEESKVLRGKLPGGHCKSLFLKDKADRVWLVVALEDRAIDLKALRRRLGARKTLSFGSPELLMELLGVIPGSVTPFGAINDHAGRVQVVLDRNMLSHDPLNYHPLTNSRTTAIAPADLLKFLRACGHEPLVLDFDAEPETASVGADALASAPGSGHLQ
ncbi:MAG TPA: prolyl-tRNA synthetase associated domain-containing protein [Alphaproteobacteria bacterium]|nr:prolyl-tRNA synthetase associated domain-containing protein [Alphaproteobacteria bacterium]